MNTRMSYQYAKAVLLAGLTTMSLGVLGDNATKDTVYQLELVAQQFDCETVAVETMTSMLGEQSLRLVPANEMLAMVISDSETHLRKKQCEIDFKLQVNPGHRLTSLGVAFDGAYNLSSQSFARAKAQIRVNSANETFSKEHFFAGAGEPSFGRFTNLSVTNANNNITTRCGEEVFIEASVFLEVISPNIDAGWSKITLDQGILELDKLVFEAC